MDFNDTMQFSGLSQSTEKWNPLTFAVYNGNLDLIKFIIGKSVCNIKRMLKIPGIFKTQEISRLFPFVMSLRLNKIEMFKYFWDELAYVYCSEETFDNLFRLLAKREQTEIVSYFLESKATKTLFFSMSYAYRSEFIEHVLQIKGEILNELNQQVIEE